MFYSEKWNWWALSRFEDVRAAVTGPADVPVLRGHRHRRHGQGPERARVPARPRQPAARPDPPGDPAAAAARPDRRAGGRRPRGGPRHWSTPGATAAPSTWPRNWPGRRPTRSSSTCSDCPAATGRSGRRAAQPWVHELKDRKPEDSGSPRSRQGGDGRHPGPTSRTCCNERRRPPARRPGHPPRHGRDRRHAVRRGGLRRRLGGPRPDDGAVPRRGGEHGRAHRDAVQAARPRTRTSAPSCARTRR